MDHAGSQPSDGREFFSTRDRAIRFHSIRDLLANRDYVRYLAAVVGPHRNLADHPMPDITFWRRRLLLDAFDLAALKDTRKLLFQHVARLAREYLKTFLPSTEPRGIPSSPSSRLRFQATTRYSRSIA